MGHFQRLKVLMTADAAGGIWGYALALARGLGPLNVDIVLATLGEPPTAAQREAAAALANLTLVEGGFRPEWMDASEADLTASGAWLQELERRHQPDIVHLNGYAHAALPFPAPVLVVAHGDQLSRAIAIEGGVGLAAWDDYRARVRAAFDRVELVVAPTRAVLADLTRHYGPLRAAQVIAHGIELGRYAPGDKRRAIFAAGRLSDAAKNLRALDRAAADLPWPVRIAGEAGDGLERAEVLGRLGAATLAREYAAAAIYAFPARYEPFGLSILEAAASGAALVLGDLPSLREVWGEDAVFVDPGDEDALRSALLDLIGDTARREALGKRARGRALTYSADRMAASYREIYTALGDGRFSLIA